VSGYLLPYDSILEKYNDVETLDSIFMAGITGYSIKRKRNKKRPVDSTDDPNNNKMTKEDPSNNTQFAELLNQVLF
jgi:hypothetical protein